MKPLRGGVALALGGLLGLLVGHGAAQAQSFANRELRSAAAPDKCVTAPSGASDNTQLMVSACNGSPGQRYTLQGDGHLQVGVRSPQGYDLCVDYYPTQGSEGSAVRLFRCRPLGGGIDSHRWTWDGSRLRGAHGGFLAPAGGEGALSAASTAVVMSSSTSRATQWVFDPPPPPPPAQPPLSAAPGRSVTLYSVHVPGKCMAPASGGGLILWDCVDNPNQRFDVLAEGYLRQGGRCVGHAGEATRFEECLRNATHQQWQVEAGVVRNRNNPAQCLDVERGANANGTRIVAASCMGSSSQRWALQPVQVATLSPAPTFPAPGPAPQPQAPTAPPTAQPFPGGNVEITGAIGSGPLPAVTELAALADVTVQYAQNLRSLYTGMQRYSSGPYALYDAQLVRQSEAVVNYIQYLINGANNPYSMQKLAAGSGGLALNETQRRLVAAMLASDPDVQDLRASHQRLASLLRPGSAVPGASPGGLKTAQYLARAGTGTGIGIGSGFSAVRPVVLASGDLDFPSPRGLASPPNTTGLDRANNLAATISWGKALSDTSMFLSYSTQVESQLSVAVDRLAAAVFRGGSVHIGQIGQAVKVFSAIKLTVQITNAAVNALAATTPSSVSSIYMNLGDRAYRPDLPPWPLAVNATVDAQVYVVPHAAGGSIVTPLGAVQLLIDAGLGPKLSGAFQRVLSNPEAARKIQETFVATMRTLGKYHVDAAATYLGNYGGSGGLASWAASAQNSIAIPARDLTPIEVNDARLIRIVHGPNIDISLGANQRFQVKGLTPGDVALVGSLNTRVPALGSGSPTFRIAIKVNGPADPSTRCIYAAAESRIIEGVLVNGRCVLPR